MLSRAVLPPLAPEDLERLARDFLARVRPAPAGPGSRRIVRVVRAPDPPPPGDLFEIEVELRDEPPPAP